MPCLKTTFCNDELTSGGTRLVSLVRFRLWPDTFYRYFSRRTASVCSHIKVCTTICFSYRSMGRGDGQKREERASHLYFSKKYIILHPRHTG